MHQLIRVLLLDILNHPHLVEIFIIGIADDGTFVSILVGRFLPHHQRPPRVFVDDLVVVAHPEFYLISCMAALHSDSYYLLILPKIERVRISSNSFGEEGTKVRI